MLHQRKHFIRNLHINVSACLTVIDTPQIAQKRSRPNCNQKIREILKLPERNSSSMSSPLTALELGNARK